MNIKTLATLVGALSLGTLTAGCASTQAAAKPTPTQESGAQASCGAGGCSGQKPAASEAKPAEAGEKPAQTQEKGEQGSCGQGSCGGTK